MYKPLYHSLIVLDELSKMAVQFPLLQVDKKHDGDVLITIIKTIIVIQRMGREGKREETARERREQERGERARERVESKREGRESEVEGGENEG